MGLATTVRLHEAVAAVCPITGVSVGTPGDSSTVVVSFDPAATGPQQAAAQGAVNAFDWSAGADAAWQNLKDRAAAAAKVSSGTDDGAKVLRAVASVLVDEINALRDWITSFKAATAAATNLANLQTRVAALASLPDRTLAQAKTAVANAINGGGVD